MNSLLGGWWHTWVPPQGCPLARCPCFWGGGRLDRETAVLQEKRGVPYFGLWAMPAFFLLGSETGNCNIYLIDDTGDPSNYFSEVLS